MKEVRKQGVESLFCPYEQALELKELGFDEEVLRYYDDETKEFCDVMKIIKAPLYQQAFRFFRERYHLIGCIDFHASYKNYMYNIKEFEYITHRTRIETYEEAELECLVKLIEIVKEQNVK